MVEEIVKTEEAKIRPSIETAEKTLGGLIPRDFEQLWRMSTIMAKSGMMPKGLQAPEQVFVAVQLGLEVGLSPMQAVQNIAVINGRPTLWGDAILALVRASGLLSYFEEGITGNGDNMEAFCKARRKGETTTIVRVFSVEDAKRAKLWGDPNRDPWVKYPRRMLQMRARSWALRDGFGDVLKGLRATEEAIDLVEKEFLPGIFAMPEEKEEILGEIQRPVFEELVAEKDTTHLDEFLNQIAKVNRANIEQIKEEAATDFDRFWSNFEKWQTSRISLKGTSAEPKGEEPPKYIKRGVGRPKTTSTDAKPIGTSDDPLVSCPDRPVEGDFVLSSYCNKTCKTRSGCPSWPNIVDGSSKEAV